MTASTGSAVGTPPTAPNVPFTRKDGRTPSQLRPLSYEQSLLHRADGSIRYSQGNTTLLVAVYGPTLASHREEQWERAVLVFTFSSTSATATVASASSTFSSAALCHHLHAAFTPIVLLSLHPRHRISVHIQLLSDDGGVLVAAVNATMLALMDAGIQCREMIAAVELRVRHDNTATGDKKAAVLLDPNKEETESLADGVTFAFPNQSSGVVLSVCDGQLDEALYLSAFDTAKRACSHIVHFYRSTLTKHINSNT